MHFSHFSYIFLEQLIGGSLINYFINREIARFLFGKLPSVPLWGGESIATDTLIIAFVLPSLTCVLQAVGFIIVNKFKPYPPFGGMKWVDAFFPTNIYIRALKIGLVSMLVFGIPTILFLHFTGHTAMETQGFIEFKAWYAVALCCLVSPFLAMALLQKNVAASGAQRD